MGDKLIFGPKGMYSWKIGVLQPCFRHFSFLFSAIITFALEKRGFNNYLLIERKIFLFL